MPLSSSSVHLFPVGIFTSLTFLFLSSADPHRHILHQQYSPLDSLPRSTQSNDYSSSPPPPPDFPFFPETSIPPPPPPPPPPLPPSNVPFASFPANISALILPQAHKTSKGASSKLIAGAFAAVVAAIILVSVSTFLHFRKRRSREFVDSKSHGFAHCSRLHHNNSVNSSNGVIPKLERPLKLSSEFLYLGTLIDSHGGINNTVVHSDSLSYSSTAPVGSSSSNLRIMGSPELRPLPPLKGKNVTLNHGNSELYSCSEDDYDNDDLYSLKWSRRGRNNSIGTDSDVELGKMVRDCSCSSSYSSLSSASESSSRSASLGISPPASLSFERPKVKSSEFVSVQLIPPPPPPPLSPPVKPIESFCKSSLVNQKESPSPSLSPSCFSPLPSPARVDSRSRDSSPKNSKILSDHNLDARPLRISSPDHQNVHIFVPSSPQPPPAHSASVHLPPPPPPLPLVNKYCDPPVLATPVRPMSVEFHTFVSPTPLPSYSKDILYNDNAEEDMETPILKMEPLLSDEEVMSDQTQVKLN